MTRKRRLRKPDLIPLSPDEAARRIEGGDNEVFYSIVDISLMFGMRPNDFLPYLRSGELHAYVLNETGLIGLRHDELAEWMVKHDRHPIETRH